MRKSAWLFGIFILAASLVGAQERFRRTPPIPDPLPTLEIPEIESYTLANNLRVFLVRKEGLPTINVLLTILTGESASPDAMPGLATFTANMLSHGSQNFSAQEIEETIDSIGGRYFSATYPDYTIFSLTFLEENLDPALKLFSDMVVRPSFSRREIEDLQRTTFYDLALKRLDPDFSGKKLLYQLLFRGHAYRKIAYNDNIIRTYTQSLVRVFYENFYRPNNAFMIITGNLGPDTTTLHISRNFNTWQEGILERIHLSDPEYEEQEKICFLEIPRLRHATIFLGTLLPPKPHEDYFPLQVLNQSLGGSLISRLSMNLRESKGYAYWAYSNMEFFKNCGIFYVRARVRPEFIKASVEQIQSEILAVSNRRIPNDEIETAKSYLLGHFPLSIETYADLGSKIAEMHALGLGDGHLNRYFDSIKSIDAQVVFETARRNSLMPPVIVIVGDGSVLENIGFEKVDVYNNRGEHIDSITKGGR
jgi:predicted Zn-dependent peptidase